MKTLTIEVEDGIVQNVKRLPKGWFYSIHDKDEGIDNHDESDTQTVRITVKSGIVEDVDNLPPDYNYQIKDMD